MASFLHGICICVLAEYAIPLSMLTHIFFEFAPWSHIIDFHSKTQLGATHIAHMPLQTMYMFTTYIYAACLTSKNKIIRKSQILNRKTKTPIDSVFALHTIKKIWLRVRNKIVCDFEMP